jgi:hypothetical protein
MANLIYGDAGLQQSVGIAQVTFERLSDADR